MQPVQTIPSEIFITNILPRLDPESMLSSERVCKLFFNFLYSLEKYHEKKEVYFSSKIYPLISAVPDLLIEAFGKQKIVRMPQFNVELIGAYPETRSEITNFLLRYDHLFCRGQDDSGRQYIAVSYHLWDSDTEVPKSFHNDSLIYFEMCEYHNPALGTPDDHDMRKQYWDCSVNRNLDLKQLLEDGVTFPRGSRASSYTLGSNKQNLQRISNISALFYEAEILWDWASMNFRHTFFGRRYTTYS